MKKHNIGKIAGLLAAVAILGTTQAKADFAYYTIGTPNSGLSGYSGPYVAVTVERTSATTATITFASLTAGGNIYLLGGENSVAVNVNATSWTVSNPVGLNAAPGFTPPSGFEDNNFTDTEGGNVSDFGSFNQTLKSFDGYTHTSDTISLTIQNTQIGGSWASANDVLKKNASGYEAAAHVYVTVIPADASGGALVSGFAATVPEPTTMIAGALLLLPFGASAVRVLRRKA